MLSFLDAEAIPVKILVNGASNWEVARPQPAPMVRRTTSGFIQKVRESILGPSSPATRPEKPPSHRSISMQLAEDPELPPLLAIMRNPVRFQNCITSVQNLCLIKRQTTRTESSLRMHDLIQYLTQHRLVQESREKIWLGAAIHIVYSAFRQLEDPSRPERWTDCELFVPQIEALAKNAETLGVESEELVAARLVIAEYFESRGQYIQALSLFEVVYSHFKRTRGNEDSLTLRAANGLASAHTHMGNLTEARELFDLVFEAYARKYGAEHEFSLRALENVAQITELQGNDVEAERLCLQVLEGHERRPGGGPEHPDTLKARRSLALSQLSQGKLEDAETNFRHILQVYERQNKPDGRETLSVVHGLACTHMACRQFDIAEPLFDRAWRGRKALLTETHHDTLAVAMNYSLVLDSTDRSIEAESVCRHAASELQRQFGSRHEDVLQANAHLAQILVHLGRIDEGEQLLKDVLGTRIQTLGEEHLETRRTARRLKTLQDDGRLDMITNLKAAAV
jgi:tetratricopeptide (TPR) repeat protein